MSFPVPVSEYVKLSTASGSMVDTVPTVAPGAKFSFTVALSSDKSVGASLTGVTVTVKVLVMVLTPPPAVPPSSVTVTVITAVPLALGTGVYFKSRKDPVPLTLTEEIRAVLPEVAVTVRFCDDSLAGPAEIPPMGIVTSELSSRIGAGSGMSLRVGASFTGARITLNVSSTNWLTVSVARTVIVAVPLALACGVIVRVEPLTPVETNPPGVLLWTA